MESIFSHTSFGNSRAMKDSYIVTEYGATLKILIELWNLLFPHLPSTAQPKHMLWWLYNCKHYPTKLVLEKALRVSAPTTRKAMKPFKEAFLKI